MVPVTVKFPANGCVGCVQVPCVKVPPGGWFADPGVPPRICALEHTCTSRFSQGWEVTHSTSQVRGIVPVWLKHESLCAVTATGGVCAAAVEARANEMA